MYESNLWAAWTLRSHDALTAALPEGLGVRDLAALTLIASHDGCSADWLWGRIGLTQSGTVRLIDRLEGLQYVVRARQGRALRLSLRPAGSAVLASWNAAREEASREALSGLTSTERREFNRLLGIALRETERVRREADTACRLCDWPACARCPVNESVSDSS